MEFDTALKGDLMPKRQRQRATIGDAAPATPVHRPGVASTSRRDDDPLPERALFEALLREVIECLDGRGVVGSADSAASRVLQREHLRRQAEAWVRSNARTPITAFVPVCETLGLDVEATREVLIAGQAVARCATNARLIGQGTHRAAS